MLFHYRRSTLEILECLLQMKQMVQSHTRGNHGQVHLEGDLWLKLLIDCVPCVHRQTRLTNQHDSLVIYRYISDVLLAFNTKFFQITKQIPRIWVTGTKLTYLDTKFQIYMPCASHLRFLLSFVTIRATFV